MSQNANEKTAKAFRLEVYEVLDFYNEANGYFAKGSITAENEEESIKAETVLLIMNDFNFLFQDGYFNRKKLFKKSYTSFTFYKVKGMEYDCLQRLSKRYGIDKNNACRNGETVKLFEEWVTSDECRNHFIKRIDELQQAIAKARFKRVLKKGRTNYVYKKIEAYTAFLEKFFARS